ncbi:transcriptional regulator with XRE-family HTH domain [Streptomyces ambofaciens]
MVAADLPIGDRIRHYRGGRRQDAVAGLVGISPDYLSQIERGLKVPSLPILYALAQELGVSTAALLSDQAPVTEEAADTAETAVGRAFLGYSPARSTRAVPATVLRDRVEAAWRSWQTNGNRFTEAAETLPDLVADVEHATRAARAGTDPAERRAVLRAAADLYCLLRSYLRRTGRVDLATIAADRAKRAAEDADDPLRIAAAQWNLGHVLLAAGQPAEAEELALRAAEQVAATTMPETEQGRHGRSSPACRGGRVRAAPPVVGGPGPADSARSGGRPAGAGRQQRGLDRIRADERRDARPVHRHGGR